jgi:glucose/arabinose dehydrogenase
MRRAAAVVALLSCAAALAPPPASAYPTGFVDELVAAVPGGPVVFVCSPDGRYFVGDVFGSIYEVASNGTLNPAPMLTLTVENFEEQGLLGMALDPGFPESPFVYVLYTPPGTSPSNSFHRVSRFQVVGSTIPAATEVVLHSTMPTAGGYHVGGGLVFGPDGRLYASVGENAYDGAQPYPQQLGRLEGKILRIGSDGSIPADNPFVGTPGALPEIYQLGLRNPLRFSFQPSTGLLWVNDVGGNVPTSRDEINRGGPGANFGFPLVEGIVPSPPPGVTNPVHDTQRNNGTAATGSAFYTGGPFPDGYDGNYFWLDHVRGRINRMVLNPDNTVASVTIPWGATASGGWFSGGVDLKMGLDGALYYCTFDPGQLRRIRFVAPVSVPEGAALPAALEPPSPNPFAGATQVRFALGAAAEVRLGVFDLAGRRIATLADGRLAAGSHVATWSGRDFDGRSVAPGVYLVRLETGGRAFTRRVARIR